MPKITISYRRTDSDVTGRIFDRLVQRYGRKSVFRDIDDIPFGSDFRKVINDALQGTDTLLAIVGPNWRGARTFGGARINEENDPVRIEVETAMQREIPVIPVLIGGVGMPKAAELPNTLRNFAFHNAAAIDSGRNFEIDVDRLMRSIDRLLRERGAGTGAQQRILTHAQRRPPLLAKRGRADIRSHKRLLDGFFKVDQYEVSYERYSGGMSEHRMRLNFERGDAVGVLLLNVDTDSVILLEQFRLPTLIGRRRDDRASQNGWITEVMAGMIHNDETPEGAAIRETLDETGYEIETAKLIGSFFSSPGGSSERIFLYFAVVSDARRPGKRKSEFGHEYVGDEEMRVFEVGVRDLFEQLEKGEIEDPKLVIAAYWLRDNIGNLHEGP